jgi:hypothetical protein
MTMYNPDQHYEAHMAHLKDLHKHAEQYRMNAAITQHRHAWAQVTCGWLGDVLVRLGTWLAHSQLRDQQPGCDY